jgi:hypothetical protein
MNEAKKLKKQAKSDVKFAKQNPFGKNSKYSGGFKNVAKYSKEGREQLKLHKSANKNWQSQQSTLFKKVDPNRFAGIVVRPKKEVTPVNPEYATRGNPLGWVSNGIADRPKSQNYINKKEKAFAKEIRKVVNPMVSRVIQNVLNELGPPIPAPVPVLHVQNDRKVKPKKEIKVPVPVVKLPVWKERKANQKKEMIANREIKDRQHAKRALKKEKRIAAKKLID